MNSAHRYRSIQIIWIRLRYKEIKKSKTVNFYCIVHYAHRGHYEKKNRTLLLYLCGGVEKNKKYKNNRNSISTRCNYETIDLTKKHKQQKIYIELYALHFL
jgi:hypothetical protein